MGFGIAWISHPPSGKRGSMCGFSLRGGLVCINMQSGPYCVWSHQPVSTRTYCLGGYVLTPWCVRLYQVGIRGHQNRKPKRKSKPFLPYRRALRRLVTHSRLTPRAGKVRRAHPLAVPTRLPTALESPLDHTRCACPSARMIRASHPGCRLRLAPTHHTIALTRTTN